MQQFLVHEFTNVHYLFLRKVGVDPLHIEVIRTRLRLLIDKSKIRIIY